MKATAEKIRQFNTILSHLHLQELKKDMVLTASNGRTAHTSELEQMELVSIINELNAKQGKSSNQMRKKILHWCHLMEWYKDDGTIGEKRSINFDKLNEWCRKYGHAHKPFNSYTHNELPMLVGQFETMYKQFLSKI